MSEYSLPLIDPQKGSWDEEAISRRRLLEIAFWTATGTTLLTLGSTGTRFLIGTSLEPRKEHWVEVGHITALPAGQVHKARYSYQTTDAWREVKQIGVLYAFTNDGVEYTVLDATCTHLGCNVRWRGEAGHFACPCHAGVFTREGEVVSGPPPKPLRRLETKIENGVLLALV
jgi:Rieske Fe-S protein